jgi:hypothetical protein
LLQGGNQPQPVKIVQRKTEEDGEKEKGILTSKGLLNPESVSAIWLELHA